MEIYVKNLEKKFENEIVLNRINFRINNGEGILIHGKNGAGKTTLLKIINLLEKPTSGKIVYISEDVYVFSNNSKRNVELQKKMVYIPQIPVVFSTSLIENVKLGLKIRKTKIREKEIERMLELFGVISLKNSFAHNLSTGQKQKISLIRGLILEVELILLDEPTNNLDEKAKEILREILEDKKRKGASFIITTPDMKEWEDFNFDRVYKLEFGGLYDITEKGKKDYMGRISSFTS